MKLVSVLWHGGEADTYFTKEKPQSGWIENTTFVSKLLRPTGFEVTSVKVTDVMVFEQASGVIVKKCLEVDGHRKWCRTTYAHHHPNYARHYAANHLYVLEGAVQDNQPNTAVRLEHALGYYGGLYANIGPDTYPPAAKLFSAVHAELQKHSGV